MPSFTTLVLCLKKCDMEHLWLVGRNFMNLVKIMLTSITTSISGERTFSTLDRVKTKLRNCMGDERMSDLVLLESYPEMVATIDLVPLWNEFIAATSYTNAREKLFGKFVEAYLAWINEKRQNMQEHPFEESTLPRAKRTRSSEPNADIECLNRASVWFHHKLLLNLLLMLKMIDL